jgi:hypothetical protein
MRAVTRLADGRAARRLVPAGLIYVEQPVHMQISMRNLVVREALVRLPLSTQFPPAQTN